MKGYTIMKYTFKTLRNIFVAILPVAILSVAGCSKSAEKHYHPYDDEYAGEDYAFFGGAGSTEEMLFVNTLGYIGENFAPSITYEIFTNCEDWKLVPDYSLCFKPEKSWVNMWPAEGKGDGRFKLSFDANVDQGDTRIVNINIVNGKGEVIKTIHVEQDQAQTTLLDVPAFLTTLNFDAETEKISSVPVNANVDWNAEVVDAIENDWIEISGKTKAKFEVSVKPNYSTEGRVGYITVYQVTNGNNSQTITIRQAGLPVPEPEE